MIPSILARQLQQGLADYLKTTFPMTNPAFQGSLENMLSSEKSMFHEPFISVRLPFRIAEDDSKKFQSIHPPFRPYIHQQKAYQRLTGENPLSTIIATGTGSGKTECFLYPILEYCYQHRGEKGIKALIVYPMNALAFDQAKRIASLISDSPELHNNVNAGMYVGGFETNASRMMSKEKVITDHDTLLSSPPDILLTNYKMLDYLLVRPKDALLWKDNDADTLKFIAVDELHTFDGAQGTDLACLLRRLKARLETPPNFLCCIGTSATLGSKVNTENIREYASIIFDETFDQQSVITEDRLSPGEFFNGFDVEDFTLPSSDQLVQLSALQYSDDMDHYLNVAIQSWFDETFHYDDVQSIKTRGDIAERLMKHSFVRSLLELMNGNYVQPAFVCEALSSHYPQIAKQKEFSVGLDALIALISHARITKENIDRPFLTVQVQVWTRELRRLMAKVVPDNVVYSLASDLNDQQAKQFLPIINCRDCGETGWITLINERGSATMTDLNKFYNLFFKQDKKIRMIYPKNTEKVPNNMTYGSICPNCLQVNIGENTNQQCSSCSGKTFSVLFPLRIESDSKNNQNYVCPFCGSKRGLSIIGLRSATEISASVSQLFSSKFNDDKKTLAFSDNVQDAAHRAGFFNSRTWRFGLRSAIQRYVATQENMVPFSQFSSKMIEYWHKKISNEEFVSYFIAPNMTWMHGYEKMEIDNKLGNNQVAKKLVADIEKRINYEIMLEYGLNSRIGRTLEKSGCSTLGFESSVIEETASRVRERTINEMGAMNELTPPIFQQMILGILNTIKLNGAFNDPVFSVYTKNDGKNFLLSNSKEKWLPGLQAGRNTPRFIYKQGGSGKPITSFDLITNSKFTTWIKVCAHQYFIGEEVYHEIGKIILDELQKSNLLVQMPSQFPNIIYGLNKERVFVSLNVQLFECTQCKSNVSFIKENASIWENAPCLRRNCNGHLISLENNPLNFYRKLYNQGDMIRVIAKEHTGMLERQDREELELAFKHTLSERKPWDANLLSCTPTLEMGIDIGDLSTVILCSIPPSQSQFLQRSGRAGRKDGNALTVVVANARPHDLYFYADPLEMISGTLVPPKVFLQASAVLERQFVAYCLDCWIKQGVSERAIPKRVGDCLQKLANKSKGIFPFNFIDFVQVESNQLINNFILMFSVGLDDSSIEELKVFAHGRNLKESPMYVKLYESFETIKKQRDTIAKSIKQLQFLIKEIESKPKDSSFDKEIRELKSERTAFLNVIRSLDNKDIFNFLSDEGLLPNYAFPEAGILLKAIMYRKEENNTEGTLEKKPKYEKMVFEYNRSASSALSEFAPANNFYVDGRKLTINQIDLTTSQTAKWRLCPNCSHAQIEETGKDVAACPQCGSPGWADTGQLRTMLKVQMVYSNMDYSTSLIGDESDDRKSCFYCKQMLVDVDEDNDISVAYRMDNDEFAWGYEFVKKATLREINFGESDLVGEKLIVSGIEEVRKGFTICKYCGKIQIDKNKPEHTYTCKANQAPTGDQEPFEECLFLYREFITEALRILIPATTMDITKVRQESFIATFMLGMKEYFGNVDHLHACISEVPVIDASYRKQYLVIYDSVPGGTGYLKQLIHGDKALIQIFEKALTILENCSCKNDPQKDGCYHCLFAYQQSQQIGNISRTTGIRLIKSILSGKQNIVEIPKLGSIPTNSLFESELERSFINALSNMGNETRKLSITKELVNNKEGYLLKIGDMLWEIEPQVVLDSQLEVAIPTRADFIIWPVRNSAMKKPVAVYTDGFLYHKDKVEDDTLKREAIRQSKKLRVWTLSWKDVQSVIREQGDYATSTLDPNKMPSGSYIYKPTLNNGKANRLHPDKMSTFELLVQYLEDPDSEEAFSIHAKAYAMSLLDSRNLNNGVIFADWKQQIEPIIMELNLKDSIFELSNTMFGKWKPRSTNSHLTILSGIETTSLQKNGINASITVCAILDDDAETRTDKYEAEWNGFWQFANVMQFLDVFVAVTKSGVQNHIYSTIPIKDEYVTSVEASIDEPMILWEGIINQVFEQSTKEYIQKLSILGIPLPSTVGFELVDDTGAVIAECEMAWEKEKIAILTQQQMDNKDIFEENGWTTYTLEDSITRKTFQGETE